MEYYRMLQEALDNGTLWLDLPPEAGVEAALLLSMGIINYD